MKLHMESAHDIRSQKPPRPIGWCLILGILQTGIGLHREKKVLILYTAGTLIENWTKNI